MSDKLQQQDFFGTESNTLMSSQVDSPAKTLAKQGHKTESQAHNLVFGQNCTELLAKLDQATPRLKALGNSIVPQIAYLIGQEILNYEESLCQQQ